MSFSQQLVVLVGGKGTRLGALTRDTPKPLMPIDSEHVFLDYLLDYALRQGFKEVLMLAGTFGDQVVSRYANRTIRGARIEVVVEVEPQGTGGALRSALDLLAPTFVALNGDTLFDFNFRSLDFALASNPDLLAVLAVRSVPDAGRFGSLHFEQGRILEFREKDPASFNQFGVINGGVYAMRRETIARLPLGPSSIEAELFPVLAAEGSLGGIHQDGYFCDIGLPDTLLQARVELPHRLRPALFFDRDGVLNHDIGHLHRLEDLEWIDGAIETIRTANDQGLAVIVVTNQAGVARGYYGEADVVHLHTYMQETLFACGAFIDAFYYCPYHKDAIIERYRIGNHAERKPNGGMLRRAARDLKIDLSASVLVGDKASDMDAAAEAGVRAFRFDGGSLRKFVDDHGII